MEGSEIQDLFEGWGRLRTRGEDLSSLNNVKPHEKNKREQRLGASVHHMEQLGAEGGALGLLPAPCDDGAQLADRATKTGKGSRTQITF